MDNACNKVTVISTFKGSRGKADNAGDDVLNDCREMSALRLSSALNDALQHSMVDLLAQAEKAYGYEIYQLYIEAMELSRDERSAIESGFRHHYLRRFNRECRRERKLRRGDESTQLSLMEPADLETSLAATTLANAIYNACSEALFALDKRMGLLVNDPELQRSDNPLGPEVISAAVLDALVDQEAAIKVKLLLVSMLNKHMPERVRDLYQELNRHLVEHGVLPTIRVGMKRSRAEAGRESAPDAAAAPAPGGTPQDLFATLQRLMGLGSAGGGIGVAGLTAHPGGGGITVAPGVGGAVGTAGLVGTTGVPATGNAAGATAMGLGETPGVPGAIAAAPVGQSQVPGQVTAPPSAGGAIAIPLSDFIHALTRLQRGDASMLAPTAVNADSLVSGESNVLRDIKGSSLASTIGQTEITTLDIVAMVFDFILDDRRIPDALKALIGRLQIPVLKVAMLDKSLFTQKAHPARRLLDSLADAAIGWNEDEGHDGGLYRKIDDLVQFILNRFEDDIDVFVQALGALQAFLSEEKQLVDKRTGESAQVLHVREHEQIARTVARDEVQSQLLGQNAPGFIRTYLHGHWEAMLAQLYQREGDGSNAWSDAVATMRDLLWSLSPKGKAEERKRLVAMLPKLLRRLEDGMKVVGVPDDERDHFFTSLVRCHADAIRAGMQATGGSEPATAHDPVPEPAPVIEPASEIDEFAPVSLPEVPIDPDPALLAEISAPPDLAVAEEIRYDPAPWAELELDGDADDACRAMLQRLKRGIWIELHQDDGSRTRVKLSWVSPLKGIYLFTNRLGKRAISISAEGLAAKCRSGKVSIIDNIPLVDRAVSNVLEKLQRNVSS